LDSKDADNPELQTVVASQRPAGVLAAGGILDRIVQAQFERLAADADSAMRHTESKPPRNPPPSPGHAFAACLAQPGINIIAEIKQRSPSKGIICEKFDPLAIASSYIAHGAAALSVLTEEAFFGGSLKYLETIRDYHPTVPLLRKDFIFDEVQVKESQRAGADALLLIAAILDDALLARLLDSTTALGLDALVEVHTRAEMERVTAARASVIGINNRDLRDFSITLDTSINLAPLAPAGSILVAESGITSGADVLRLRRAGFSAFLIGEHFMRTPDPGLALHALLAGARIAEGASAASTETLI
jgi:indole-3-glycerol phosphate synthase